MWSASTAATVPVGAADHDVAGVHRGAALDAGAHQRGLGDHQRHGLALHVGAHEGAVGVVVLEERDERRRHRDDLLRRHVHVLDVGRVGQDRLAALAAEHRARRGSPFASRSAFACAMTLCSSWVASSSSTSVGDLALHDAAVRGLDEPELVQGRVAAERADQADVRALRGLDRAHAPVVGLVDVAHLDGGALAGEAARAERRQAAPVGEAGQRVGLVHELRQLRGAEELLQRRDHRADVDDRLRGDRVDVLGAHALADDALHPVEADAEGLLDELADRAQAPVAEVLVLVEVARDLVARHRGRRRRRSPWSPRAARS